MRAPGERYRRGKAPYARTDYDDALFGQRRAPFLAYPAKGW
jgi:hypothetical protein